MRRARAAAAERAVHGDFARRRLKAVQDLGHHDRTVRARRRLAGGEDLSLSGVRPVQFFLICRETRAVRPGYRGRRCAWRARQEASSSRN